MARRRPTTPPLLATVAVLFFVAATVVVAKTDRADGEREMGVSLFPIYLYAVPTHGF
jgi:hypothetical protein